MARSGGIIAGVVVVGLAVAAFLYMTDFDVVQEARLPDVSISGGQMPKVKADVGTVTVGTERKEISVPDVDVKMKKEVVEVPTVSINPPAKD